MERLDEIKSKFKDVGTICGSDVVWLFMKIKDLETTINRLQSDNVYTLVDYSNAYHNAIYDYISNNGFDEKLIMEFEVKIEWLKFVADKYGINLNIKN